MTDQPLLFEDLHVDVAAERAAQEREQRRREAEEGERRKQEGIERASWGRDRCLGHAREIASDVARGVLPHADGERRADGLVTADDVQFNWQREQPPLRPLGNLAGGVFRDGNWEFTGEWVKSARKTANANDLRVWRRVHKESSLVGRKARS